MCIYLCAYIPVYVLDMCVYTRVCNVFISQHLNHINIVLIIAQSILTCKESLAILGTLSYNNEHFPRVITDMIQNR